MKKVFIALSVSASFLLIGCGSGGSSVSDADINYEQQNIFAAQATKVDYKDYTVNVVDDEIVNAKVSAPECEGYKELGDGTYLLTKCVSKPSFIVVEGGQIGDSGVEQAFPLVLNTSQTDLKDNFVVTPITTLLSDASSDEIDEIANRLGLDRDKIFKNPSNTTAILQKVNAIYLKGITDGAIASKKNFVDALRETIKEKVSSPDDFDINDIAQDVEIKSQRNPGLFGIVFMGTLPESDPLTQIKELQHPQKVSFLGLVFDDKVKDANITVYREDTGEIIADNIVSGENGEWNLTLSDDWENEIMSNDFVISFEAKAADGNITLKSSVTSAKLRDVINKYKMKRITPSKTPTLILSNITTTEHAILKKRGAFKDVKSYDNNMSDIKTYYGDKILRAAAVIKDVVDNNNSKILKNADVNNTYDLVLENIKDSDNLDFNSSLEDANTSVDIKDLEQNITSNALLKRQMDSVYANTLTTTFKDAAKNSGYVFYRILAYYLPGDDGDLNTSDDVFVREYDKIITLPGKYEIKKCYLYGDSTGDWDCQSDEVSKNANFIDSGDYQGVLKGYIYDYKLNNISEVFVSKLCKTYKLYSVTRSEMIGNSNLNSDYEVFVDSFDVVDMFRRMPTDDTTSFNDLKTMVEGKGRDEVNYELNRYVRDRISDVQNYFSDSNTLSQCQ
jgi:hypothetical protein